MFVIYFSGSRNDSKDTAESSQFRFDLYLCSSWVSSSITTAPGVTVLHGTSAAQELSTLTVDALIVRGLLLSQEDVSRCRTLTTVTGQPWNLSSARCLREPDDRPSPRGVRLRERERLSNKTLRGRTGV